MRIFIFSLLLFCLGFSGVKEITVDGDVLARTHTSSSGDVIKVEVIGHATAKPDEGNGKVTGTVQWAVDRVVPGGEIHLLGGEDFRFRTSLRVTKSGVRIRCFFGKGANNIKPTMNMDWVWKIGDGSTAIDLILINGCSFYGQGDSGMVAGGVLFNNVNNSKFVNNDMQLFKRRTFEMKADGRLFSNINTVAGNVLYNCGAACIATTGAGGNSDHWFVNNIFFVSSLNSNEAVGIFRNSGGHKFSNNHWFGSKAKGCVRFNGGGNNTINGEYWDTCGDGPFVDANLSNSSISGRFYNNGAMAEVNGKDALIVRGNYNNVGPIQVKEPQLSKQRIRDGVVLAGDKNNITSVSCHGISGKCVRFTRGGDHNKLGLVNGSTTKIENHGAGNVQVKTEAIPSN